MQNIRDLKEVGDSAAFWKIYRIEFFHVNMYFANVTRSVM